MSISSMTGFARKTGELELGNIRLDWFLELKSVNGKSLDIKTKFPSFLDSVSLPAKNVLGKYFSRGNIGVYLDLSSSSVGENIKVNDEVLEKLTLKAIDLYDKYADKLLKPSAADLLSLRGVIEGGENRLAEEQLEALQRELLISIEEACKLLQEDRQKEGQKIRSVLLAIVKEIESRVLDISKMAESQPVSLKERLLAQVAELKAEVSEERLAQEIVLLVAKADIREEIDRLKMHLKTANELLNGTDPVGRRLDFLCQELNREANTTCSKACDIKITNLGIELKTLIEQFREQVQNIE